MLRLKSLPTPLVLVGLGLAMPGLAAPSRGLQIAPVEPAESRPPYRQQVALIVGIDHFTDGSLDLDYAVSDARGVEKVLRERFAFDRIVTLYDDQATRANVLSTLGELSELDPEDALLVFWAGHGYSEETADGEALGYLLPHDGSMDPAEALAANLSMEQFATVLGRRVPAKHKLLVVDACYSGILTTREALTLPPPDAAYVDYATSRPVFQVLTAGKADQTVLDGGPGGHSVFTGVFLQSLEQIDAFGTASEIGLAVQRDVRAEAWARGRHEQTPDFGRITGGGDFVFTASPDAATAPSALQRRCVSDLRRHLAEAEAAYGRGELDGLEAHVEGIEQGLGCLTDALPSREVARVHRFLGLAAHADGDTALGDAFFVAARATRPELLMPSSLVPATSALRERFDAAREVPTETAPAPAGALVDGGTGDVLPLGRPYLLQERTDDGLASTLVRPKGTVVRLPEAEAHEGSWMSPDPEVAHAQGAGEDYLAWLEEMDAERREREAAQQAQQAEALRIRNAAWEVTERLAGGGGEQAVQALQAFRARFGPEQLAFDASSWAHATLRLSRVIDSEEDASGLRNELINEVSARHADGVVPDPARPFAEQALVDEMDTIMGSLRQWSLSGDEDRDGAMLREQMPRSVAAVEALVQAYERWGSEHETLARVVAARIEAPLHLMRLGLSISAPAEFNDAEKMAFDSLVREMVVPQYLDIGSVVLRQIREAEDAGLGSAALDSLRARMPCHTESARLCPAPAELRLRLLPQLAACAGDDAELTLKLRKARAWEAKVKGAAPSRSRSCVAEAAEEALNGDEPLTPDPYGPQRFELSIRFRDDQVEVGGSPWPELAPLD